MRKLILVAVFLFPSLVFAANGDFLDSFSLSGGGKAWRYKALDAATAGVSGTWIDARAMKGKKTFHVTGIGTGTVQVYCSNGQTTGVVPADSTDDAQMGGDITTNTVVTIEDACSFVKMKKSAAGDSTATTVILQGDSEF